MGKSSEVTTLLLDIGGVLLTNGWDRHMRRAAAEKFGLDHEEMDERHHLTFDTYEEGKLTLDEYLKRVVFYKERSFSPVDFKEHMFAQSQPKTEEMAFFKALRKRHKLRVAAVSNEGRELTEYRIEKFKLDEIIEFFVSSCFVHVRKPDVDMYRFAMDISHSRPAECIYVDDREMYVTIAGELGLHGIHHTSVASTREALAQKGLD